MRILCALATIAPLGSACGSGEIVNGCDAASAEDRTGEDRVEIRFAGEHGYSYVPACVRARVGSRLVFRGPFELHPLGSGRLVDGISQPSPANPVRDTAEGERVAFPLDTPGAYGFFCHVHTGEGMMGAVFVE